MTAGLVGSKMKTLGCVSTGLLWLYVPRPECLR